MAQLLFIILIFVLIFLEFFWLKQLIHLMMQKDDVFPGKYDKPLWVAILFFANIIGAYVYFITRTRLEPRQTADIEESPKEHSELCLKCGKTIPPDSTRCPSCGWSYKGDK